MKKEMLITIGISFFVEKRRYELMEQYKTVTFNIQGEFITQMAKEWFFYENRGYDKVMELLFSCMEGTEQSEKEIRRLAEDILLGRAALVGSTRDNSYHMEVYDPDEQPENPDRFNVFKKMTSLSQKLKDTEKELEKMQEWYSVAMEYVPEYWKNNVLRETGQPVESQYGKGMLDSFMERMMDEEEHSTGDYGWLEPNGTFHEVEWAKHQEWAEQYIRKNMTEEEWLLAGVHLEGQVKTASYNSFGDYLVDRGWVLLHNPSQGLASPTRNPIKRYTKAQQEFLFDYYMGRGKEKEANDVYQD